MTTWIEINDADPSTAPPEAGNYLAATHTGLVTTSFYSTLYPPGTRKENGKIGRCFCLARQGYRVTYWAHLPDHPDPKHQSP